MEDDGPLLSIGELTRRVRLPVRTIRFWSDAGVLPPAARTGGGRRLYDAACVARLELVVTLRELGLGLPDVRRVLDGQVSNRRGRRRPPGGARRADPRAAAAPRGAGRGGQARGRQGGDDLDEQAGQDVGGRAQAADR